MEEGDFITTARIDLRYPKWDVSVLGGLKNTHRILLKILHAQYEAEMTDVFHIQQVSALSHCVT